MGEEWITRAEAARILECSPTQVGRFIERGQLTRRSSKPRSGRRPSISLDEALRLREQLVNERAAAERAQVQRAQERELRRRYVGEPPDLEHEWLNSVQAAQLLGITRPGLAKRQKRGRVPYVEHAGRIWFRRDLIQQFARARQARRTGQLELLGEDRRVSGGGSIHSQ